MRSHYHLVALALSIAIWFSCTSAPESSEPLVVVPDEPAMRAPEADRANIVVLPTDPVRLSIHQRSWATIPGSQGRVRVHLDDITGSQVMLSVTMSGEGALFEPRSVHAGDVICVQLGDEELFVKVVELHNFLFGDDFGEVDVSKSRLEPEITRSREGSEK